KIGPKLMRIDLREAAAAMQSAAGAAAGDAEGVTPAARPFDVRAYRAENPTLAGKAIRGLAASTKGVRAPALRVRPGPSVLDPASDHRIQAGGVIAVMAKYEIHAARGDVIGPEVSDPELLDIPLEALDVVLTNRTIDGRSLAELAQGTFARGVFM